MYEGGGSFPEVVLICPGSSVRDLHESCEESSDGFDLDFFVRGNLFKYCARKVGAQGGWGGLLLKKTLTRPKCAEALRNLF